MKPIHRFFLPSLLLLSLAGAVTRGAAPADTRVFRAGAATSNITPPLGISINGGMSDRRTGHIHDELHVRCLALDDGTTKFILVVCDSCMIPREVFDEARRLVHEATGLPREHMLLSATHTHFAPTAAAVFASAPDAEYRKFLSHRIADGVRRALNNLEPARIGWGVGREPNHVSNRRWFVTPETPLPNPFGGVDKLQTNPPNASPRLVKPAGPVDPEVSVVSVVALSGRPIGVYACYSVHYVAGVPDDHVSASYFGAFAEKLQRRMSGSHQDPPFVAMMANGTSGDVINTHRDKPLVRREPYEQSSIVGDDLARVVQAVVERIGYRDWVPIKIAHVEQSLAVRKPAPEEVARARAILAPSQSGPSVPPAVTNVARIYAQETLDLASYPDRVSLMLQAVRIGDLGITAIPCEVFVEIGLELKAKSPFKPSFTVSLANGYNGYLPTAQHHEWGGYETWRAKSSYLEVDAASRISATLLELLGQLSN